MLHGQTRYNIASSFFHEIPEALLKRINRAGAYATRAPGTREHRNADTTTAARHDKAAVARAAGTPDPASPWHVGQNVTHPKFGAGIIVNAEGRGSDARVQVNFDRNGTKWLALEYAKLSAA
jgi:DNA helicase-2/ATP-dependent DNA helicase PcrA